PTHDVEEKACSIKRADEFTANNQNAFMSAQFDNSANPDYHYETTAPELFDQMEGQIDAVVIGVGTAGTFTGIARFLKKKLPKVLAIPVETEGSVPVGSPPGKHKVGGIRSKFITAN